MTKIEILAKKYFYDIIILNSKFGYIMELLPKQYRSFAGVNAQTQYTIGYMILCFLGTIPVFHNWHYFAAAISVFSVFAIAMTPFLGEPGRNQVSGIFSKNLFGIFGLF